MQYNKQQRQEIYITARFLFHTTHYMYIGMCSAIQEAIRIIHGEYVYYSGLSEVLPEIEIIKPDCLISEYGFWWDRNDRDIRIEMFNKIIELTKPENNA